MWTVRVRLRRLAVAATRSEELAADDREARDESIMKALDEGLSVRVIASDTGLSKSRIQAIGVERTAARQAELERQAGLGGPPVGP
jgi:hypothetical protein